MIVPSTFLELIFFDYFFFFVAAVFEDNLDILNLFKDYVGLVTVTVYDSESKFGVLSSGLSRFCFIHFALMLLEKEISLSYKLCRVINGYECHFETNVRLLYVKILEQTEYFSSGRETLLGEREI